MLVPIMHRTACLTLAVLLACLVLMNCNACSPGHKSADELQCMQPRAQVSCRSPVVYLASNKELCWSWGPTCAPGLPVSWPKMKKTKTNKMNSADSHRGHTCVPRLPGGTARPGDLRQSPLPGTRGPWPLPA